MATTTHAPDDDSLHRQFDEFMSWLVQKSGVRVNPSICLANIRSDCARRGIVAQTNISEGEELFTIPRGLILSTSNSKLRSLLSKDLESLDPWLSLILVMIYEYLSGDKSFWAPYFRILPKKFDTLMFWSESELFELQGSKIINKIGRQSAEESIIEVIAPIVRGNPSLFPPIGGLSSYDGDAGTEALLKLGHIMGSLILAYAFDLEESELDENDDGEDSYVSDDDEQLSKGMVPLADLLNADPDRNNARLDQEEDYLTMRATKPIKQGDEVFDDLGEIPRSDLLRRYGYVTDNYAPYDVVELSLDGICQAAGLEDANIETQNQLQFLEGLDLLDDGYTIPRPSPDDSLADILPEELLLLVKTLTLSPEQFQHQVSKRKPPKPTLGSPEKAILKKAVQLESASYGTSILQDQEILEKLNQLSATSTMDTFFRRQRMAIQVRVGEKVILQNLLTMLDGVVAERGDLAAKRHADSDNQDPRGTKVQRI